MAFLIEALTEGARSAFPLFQSLAESTLSANAILRQVSEAGFAVRRQTGLDIVGALRNNIDAARQFRLINPNTIPDVSKFGVAVTNTISNFTYTVKATGINAVTGQPVTKFVNVRSNTPISQNDALAVADSYLGEADKYENLANYDLRVTGAIRNPNYA